MKVIGVIQFIQKKFKLLPITGKWLATFGQVPVGWIGIVCGRSGNGKTEFCIQFAKYLTEFGKVAWLSYEQQHGYDLQTAIIRNKMQEVAGKFLPIDPTANLKENESMFEDLMRYLSKRGSPEVVFVDSIDYLRLTEEQYKIIKVKFGQKKIIIFLSHATDNGMYPKSKRGEAILYDGGVGIYVKNYIAFVDKNRFGGFEPYVVWEEKARLKNPLFFEQQAVKEAPVKKKPAKQKPEKTEE